ncbi:MAG: nucleotidyltransferase domain-containing protein [Acidobacteria bacterium]|nr:nucleotidyltransferase domain-containing protein [Acidobacteriota bacterium]
MKVFEPEPAKVEHALQSLLEELRSRKEVCAVWLIGSYHRRDFGPFSDVDLVLIVENSDKRFFDRAAKYVECAFPVPMDLFVYTAAEVREMQRTGHPFWKHIEKNHTTLFETR